MDRLSCELVNRIAPQIGMRREDGKKSLRLPRKNNKLGFLKFAFSVLLLRAQGRRENVKKESALHLHSVDNEAEGTAFNS